MFAIAPSIGIVLTARLLDRVGKGIRGAPRDALVADIAPPHPWGGAFGWHQSLDRVGAFVGPLLALRLMLLWQNNSQAVFWMAVIAGAVAVFLLAAGCWRASKLAIFWPLIPEAWLGSGRADP